MLYDKHIRPVCAHCLCGQDFTESHTLCRRFGPVAPDYTCSHFQYDPLRRLPPKPARILMPQQKDAFKL